METAAAWSWRVLVIAAAAALVAFVVSYLRVLTIPLALALLLSALAVPAVDWLDRRLPRAVATALVIIGGLVILFGLLGLVGQQIASGFSNLADQVTRGIDQIRNWLIEGPLSLSQAQIDRAYEQLASAISSGQSQLAAQAAAVGITVGHTIAGFFLMLFASIFFLHQGEKIWHWTVRMFPRAARERVDESGRLAWVSLTAFVRATVIVAFVDALGIGLVAFVLDVPLLLPLTILVFLGSFIPIVGATLSGAVAVLVALVAHGPLVALLMLAGVVGVQQLESHILQPFLLGRAVRVHPLAVIVSIAAGSLIAGVVGALLAVPFLAVANTVVRHLAGHDEPTIVEEAP